MSEFRQDPITGDWVIVAPARGGRPRVASNGRVPTRLPAHDPDCPFCPGNERLLPGIIEETPSPEPPGWSTRVVPNKYPALTLNANGPPSGNLPWVSRPGHGSHEVIIETPRHDTGPESLAPAALTEVLRTCRRRYAELVARPGIGAVVVFRNHGVQGGASLAHPHAQVIATGLVPSRLVTIRDRAREHHARQGQCLTCEIIARELEAGQRVVEVSDEFVALVPFAAARPFEQHLLPRRHRASFAEATDGELAALARMLRRALRRLNAILGQPSWNYAIDSGTAEDRDAPHAHWSLRLWPGTTRPGGFELGAGMSINPSLPEADAEALRAAGP